MDEWAIVPVKPTEAMLNAVDGEADDKYVARGRAVSAWQLMLSAAPPPPHLSITADEARACQRWAGMDGACAFHLIERHADGWGDVALMMQAWLEANRVPPNVEAQGREHSERPSGATGSAAAGSEKG